ncbi:glycoside hydrolase family 97 protein [Persicobacter diffluens]|uniref:Alpha-glucosidase n=1 Tax=Persicobacter diffluens TaxID=981 RepID=A0AAN4W1V5_9BACT|nr:alpha-glucosidase [Persicobacter diffluens]
MRTALPLFFICCLFWACQPAQKLDLNLQSPDGHINLNFDPDAFQYTVKKNQKAIMAPSQLGLIFKEEIANGPYQLINSTKNNHQEKWQPVWGQFDEFEDHHNEMILNLENAQGFKMNVIFRAFNDGLAFRYQIPAQKTKTSLHLIDELTTFALAKEDTVWWTEGNANTYERPYQKTLTTALDSANTPITIEGENGLIVLHEAALVDYSDMRLKNVGNNTYKAHLCPWPDGTLVKTQSPMQSPWRTIILADDLNGLVASSMILNLNEPSKIKDTSWIHPFKYIGIWWGMHTGYYTWTEGERHGANTKNAKAYIDFAAKHNIEGVLFEGWNKGWENWGKGNFFDFVTPYDDFDFEEVADYAQKKNVQLIGHHETGGNIPMYEQKLDTALKQLVHFDMHALKTGYAGGIIPEGQPKHGQFMVRHYLEVVKKGAENKIMINAHEPIKPTGLERTYPNMMTREGARGMEYNGWSKKITPEHTTVLPFTRIIAGPMDYTPGIFNITYDGQKQRWHPKDTFAITRVNTTLAKQMALWVVLYSPQQMASDLIENYEGHPCFKFFQDLPSKWNESRVIDGKIGDFAVIGRRHENDWYVGAITDEHPRKLKVELDFLEKDKKYRAVIYGDGPETDYDKNPKAYQIKTIDDLSSADRLELDLCKSGGSAIQIIPL